MQQVFQPYLFTIQSAAAEIHNPFPNDNEYDQQTAVWEMLRLARTLGEKLSHSAPEITKQEQDILLKRLYFGEAETVQAASANGLITSGTEADKPVEPVFLMDPSLVATHNNLHRSLHQSNEQSQPPSRHGMYTQTHQMYALARAIDDNQCEKDKDPSMPKWERFLGLAPASVDHALLTTPVSRLWECLPSLGTSLRNFLHMSFLISTLGIGPKSPTIPRRKTTVNSKLRNYLSNIMFVDMTDEALEALKVPTTLPDFLAWKEGEDSQMSNAEGWHPKLSTCVGSAKSSEGSRHESGVETLG